MENIRDLAVEGWMSQTSRKGKGPGKNKGRTGSGETGSEEDRSWGQETVDLRKDICKELGPPEVEVSIEAVAGGSGLQGSVKERDSVMEERTDDRSSSEDEVGEDGSEEGGAGLSEIKVVDEVRKDRRTDEKRHKIKEREDERREGERGRESWRSKVRLAPSVLSGGEMQRQDQEVVQDPGGVEGWVRVLDVRQGSGSEEEKYVWTARGFVSKGTSW